MSLGRGNEIKIGVDVERTAFSNLVGHGLRCTAHVSLFMNCLHLLEPGSANRYCLVFPLGNFVVRMHLGPPRQSTKVPV